MTDTAATSVDRLVVDPDALDQAIDALADDGDSPLALINASNTAALARATRDLANALSGAQRIAGRDGRDGKNGRDGRPGESLIEFRQGYDLLTAPMPDPNPSGGIYVGHAVHLTAETDEGWWIERRFFDFSTSLLIPRVTVELPDGVLDGRLRWPDRESYTYRPSEIATRRYRLAIAQLVLEFPEVWVGIFVDAGLPPDYIAAVRRLVTEYLHHLVAGIETGGDEPAQSIRAASLLAPEQPWWPSLTAAQQDEVLRGIRKLYTERYAVAA